MSTEKLRATVREFELALDVDRLIREVGRMGGVRAAAAAAGGVRRVAGAPQVWLQARGARFAQKDTLNSLGNSLRARARRPQVDKDHSGFLEFNEFAAILA